MSKQRQSLKQIVAAEERGQIAAVVELCLRHLSRYPEDQYVLIWYAMMKRKLAKYTEAERAIRRAIALGKRNRRFWGIACWEMGSLYLDKGELRKAVTWHRRAARLNPKFDYYIFAGNAAFKSGRLKQAEAFFRKSIQHPASCRDEAYFNLGGICVAQRRYQQAIDCYRKTLKIDPKYPNAKTRLRDAELALRLKSGEAT